MPQNLVGPPVLGKFNDRARQVPVKLLQFGFKPGKKGKSVSGRPGKASHNFIVIKSSQLLRGGFQHLRAVRYLAVRRHDYLVLTTDAEYGRGSDTLFHSVELPVYRAV